MTSDRDAGPGLAVQHREGIAFLTLDRARVRNALDTAAALALRAARDERFLALKALREKRERDGRARHLHWRRQLPVPRQPG